MIWLSSGILALLLFWIVPTGESVAHIAGPLLMVVEISFLKLVADKILLIKRRTGVVPSLRERLALLPMGVGMIFYATFIGQTMSRTSVIILGTASVVLVTVSKLMILRSRLAPGRREKIPASEES